MINNYDEMFSQGGATDSGDSSYAQNELLGAYKDLTYQECRNIYRYWPLGKRVASALPNFAMSAGRSFISELPEVNDALEKAAESMSIENVVNRTTIYSRIYGLSFVYLASDDKKRETEAITYEDFHNGTRLKFNVLDPLSAGGSITIDNNSLSPMFGMPIGLRVKGRAVHTKRIHCCYNDIPLYFKFNPSSYSFSGPSIYQNMTLVIRSWNRTVIALQRIATKAASILVKRKDSSNVTSLQLKAINRNLSLIREMENDGIAALRVGEEAEFFQLTGVSEIDAICNRLNSMLMMALSDTPSGILLDKNLSTGLADGDNDMKAILMSVDRFRKDILTPIYRFLDKFICYKAFSPEFLEELKELYPDKYRDKSTNEILNELIDSYNFKYNDLYPQTQNEQADTASKYLDNLTKIKELGGELSGIEEAINNYEIVPGVDIVLSEEKLHEQDMLGNDYDSSLESNEAPKGIDTKDTEQ